MKTYNLRILIISADETVREGLSGKMEKLACRHESVKNFPALFKKMRENRRYDVIFFYNEKNTQECLNLAEFVGNSLPGGDKMRIVALSQDFEPAERKRCLQGGLFDFLPHFSDETVFSQLFDRLLETDENLKKDENIPNFSGEHRIGTVLKMQRNAS